MNISIAEFTINREYQHPPVLIMDIPDWLPLDRLDLTFEAFGADYDDVDTLFAIMESGDRIYDLRYGWGAIWLLELIQTSDGYTIERPEGDHRAITLTEDQLTMIEQTHNQLHTDLTDD